MKLNKSNHDQLTVIIIVRLLPPPMTMDECVMHWVVRATPHVVFVFIQIALNPLPIIYTPPNNTLTICKITK